MNHAERRAAREARDRSYDCRFVFAVVTTSVYCRPSCTSPPALERNVRYFDDITQAHAAGFRPCKRCRPDERIGADERVVRACRILDEAEETPTLAMLAERVGLSAAYLQRRFSREIGISPRRYGQFARERRLRDGLSDAASVTEAIHAAGYGSAAAAYEGATQRLGMNPSMLREHGRGAVLHYAVVASKLGWVLVAASAAGICRVDIDDDERALVERFERAFANARIERADDQLESATSRIVAYLASEGPWPLLPLDVRATAFQRRVWNALRTIAPGRTMRYSELAAALGSPRAARAVARACASNPIALLIPCHRIVPAAGGAGDYRWGAQRKAELLRLERGANERVRAGGSE